MVLQLTAFQTDDHDTQNVVETEQQLFKFFDAVLPENIPRAGGMGIQTRDEFQSDVKGGVRWSTVSIRLMPFVLSRINWADPANCPIFRQSVPLRSIMIPDHPRVKPDPLHERADSPVKGIVHRYPDKALMLPVSVCPVYCTFCTREHLVGPNTYEVVKDPPRLSCEKLEDVFAYIESRDDLKDIVVSGGDAYYLAPHILERIGDRLIGMKNIERFRIASKGLAVAPHRFFDENDSWTKALL